MRTIIGMGVFGVFDILPPMSLFCKYIQLIYQPLSCKVSSSLSQLFCLVSYFDITIAAP